MCTGRAPFRGDSGMAVIRQVCDVDPPSIRSINPDVPKWLEGIVRKLHAKVPADRFQSAAEVAELLERGLAHMQQPDQHPLPWPAEEPTGVPATRPASPRSRSRWRPVAAALALVALIGAALLLGPRLRLQPTEPSPEMAATREVSAAPGLTGAGLLADLDVFEKEAGDLRSKLDRLQQSLSVESMGDNGGSLEPALHRARHSAEKLRGELSEAMAPSIEPVDAGLESIRRRLERLQEGGS
jgi:serine/threonine protein kinase